MMSLSDFKKSIIPQLVISYVFLVSGLFVNFLELLTLIFIWPINKHFYKRVNYYLAITMWGNLTCLAQWWAGSDFHLFCTDETKAALGHEHAISVMNHHYDIDWLFGWVFCQRTGLLGGSKVFNKSATKYLPIVGWSFWFNQMLFLNRDWATDKKSIGKGVDAIIDTPEDIHFNITILSEGTRFTEEKHAASMEVAKQKGLPLLKHHLLPRTKGFVLFVQQVAGRIEWLYDITICINKVNGTEKPTLKHIKDGVPVNFEIYLRRIPMSSIPVKDDKECADWLHQLYREKDEIFDRFEKNGTFGEHGDIKKHYLKKNGYDAIISLMWIIIIAVPSAYYLLAFLVNGAWITKIALIGFFIIVNYAVKYLISSTDVKKASDFGLDKSPNKKKKIIDQKSHKKKGKPPEKKELNLIKND